MIRSTIRGIGAYLPAKVMRNDELPAALGTSDDWIQSRTGIRQRHLAAEGELTSDLAVAAARQAILRADIDPRSIDTVIVATSTPDNTFPATATAVQRKLELQPGIAFDVQAVCAGFPYALATADGFLRTGLSRRALVIGAETFSRILDWNDRGTCVLFGDGAGAMVLEAQEQKGDTSDRGLLGITLGADGRNYDDLFVDGGPSRGGGRVGVLKMNGREVFRFAVVKLAEAAEQAAALAGIPLADIDWMVPHQANARIIDGVGKKLGFPAERVVLTVGDHANTSAASIPLAINAIFEDGRLQRGHTLVANALGGGFSWGAVCLRW
ncbi:3-oxoacyl-[acyl-carrier-protein] synthase-3 [Arboricoccus pini]|uniref:Beta-ketoacyl-[acyl-carrier-protein] synthase III n=1 Tax=Arboricoccus pini TaxID=1963835 RepID=A0A212PZ91_9PROT|nr:beta-ketoacyl-ACP synthase III [Arboricoccus pini]SNB52274.1 3-oxoacyl-[acyl-carrier-protein] synthase-3 [Arboricoccus pini]